MGKFFSIKEWDTKNSMEEIKMNTIEFWIQVHNLPLNYMNMENAPIIGNQLGKDMKYEDSMYRGVLVHPYLWIKVLIPLNVPLKSSFCLHKHESNKC